MVSEKNESKKDADELIANHGPRNWFVRWLYNFRMLGWLLFSLTLGYLFIVHAIAVAVPKPTLVINDKLQIVGQIDWFDDLNRTSTQFKHAGMRFLECKLSYNSVTIMEDVECALNFMGDELLKNENAVIVNNPIYYKISKSNTRSFMRWAKDVNGNVKVSFEKLTPTSAIVRYQGKQVLIGKSRKELDFNITLYMSALQRSDKNTYGVIVEKISDQ